MAGTLAFSPVPAPYLPPGLSVQDRLPVGTGRCRQAGSFLGSRLVPPEWRALVPPTSPLRGCFATGTPQRAHGPGPKPLGSRNRQTRKLSFQDFARPQLIVYGFK